MMVTRGVGEVGGCSTFFCALLPLISGKDSSPNIGMHWQTLMHEREEYVIFQTIY